MGCRGRCSPRVQFECRALCACVLELGTATDAQLRTPLCACTAFIGVSLVCTCVGGPRVMMQHVLHASLSQPPGSHITGLCGAAPQGRAPCWAGGLCSTAAATPLMRCVVLQALKLCMQETVSNASPHAGRPARCCPTVQEGIMLVWCRLMLD